jgi:hypothetical protein
VAPFLIKLFEIVSSPASDDLVCWSEHGESFRIVDRAKFAQVRRPSTTRHRGWLPLRPLHSIAAVCTAQGARPRPPAAHAAVPAARQDVLPLYFKHDNLRSFIRQLNIYGFQRCQNASGRDRTMKFFHPTFTRNGMRNLKDIKRGNQSKKHDQSEEVALDEAEPAQAKKQRIDYTAFKMDVARLQKNLEEFEYDLKEHTLQVQQKLTNILSALDDAAVPPSAVGLGGAGISPAELAVGLI